MATIDYSNRDYATIKQDLLSRASTLIPEWTSRDTSDFGVLMVDLWAYMGDVLHYYVDRAAAEAFVDTATQRESILAIANLYDYVPHLQTAARATVTVTGNNIPAGTTIAIPAGTMFVSPATADRPIVYFTSTVGASVTSASSSAVLSVVEGEPITEEYVGRSNGLPSQRFKLYNKGVIGDSVVVNVYEGTIVSGTPSAVSYRYVERLLDYGSTDKVFTLEVNANNETTVIFGNDLYGKIPSNGQKVTVSYRKGKGTYGNVPAGSINQFAQSISPYLSSVVSTAAVGGDTVESITNLKINIPAAFSTQSRAVSLQDYKSLALFVAGIAKATATYNSTTRVVSIYPVGFATDYLNTVGSTLTLDPSLVTNLVNYYEPRTMVGASVSIVNNVSLTAVNITGTVYVNDGYIASNVQSDVEDALDTLFAFESVSFNQTLSKAQIYKTIMGVEGVYYVTLSSPSTETVSSGATGLFKKGTYTLTTSGGVTGS